MPNSISSAPSPVDTSLQNVARVLREAAFRASAFAAAVVEVTGEDEMFEPFAAECTALADALDAPPPNCQRCGLPMSQQDTPQHEPGEPEKQWICDGPNDSTKAKGCWSVADALDVQAAGMSAADAYWMGFADGEGRDQTRGDLLFPREVTP